MLIVITFLIFLSSFIFGYLLLNIVYKNQIQIMSRLERIKNKKKNNKEMDELGIPFYERVIEPINNKISDIVTKITPSGMKKRMEEKIIMAGRPYNLTVNQWFIIKTVIAVIIPLIFLLYIIFNGLLFSQTSLTLIIIVLIINLLPNLILQQITSNRQKQIVNSLPDILDLLTVSIEAGLSFDGAVARLVESMPGVLSTEFGRTLNEMRMGKTRKEALRDMSVRCGVPDLTAFIGSLIQADELGVGISNILRVQSVQMRQKRRQRAQEKAMKAPIKMLFPLIFFIFPAIFAVLLGPAIIRIIDVFGK